MTKLAVGTWPKRIAKMPTEFNSLTVKIWTGILLLACSFQLQCFAKNKTPEDYVYDRVQYLEQRGDFDEAAKRLVIICHAHPTNANLWIELGNCYLNDTTDMADSVKKAEEYFKKALSIDPQLGRAYFKLSQWAANQAKYGMTIEMANKALSAKKPDYAAYLSRAGAYIRLHKDKEALADMDKYIALGNRTYEAYQQRATALENLGMFDRAVADYRAMQKLSTKEDAFYKEAECLEKSNKLDEAISLLTNKLKRNQDDETAFESRGKIFAKKGRYKEAVDDFTAALKLAPAPSMLKERASAYEKMGKKDLADKDRREAERM